jgi:hypothetical protein
VVEELLAFALAEASVDAVVEPEELEEEELVPRTEFRVVISLWYWLSAVSMLVNSVVSWACC